MNEQVSISIKLLNRVYKVKVAVDNEATVRTTAHLINEKLAGFKKNFPGRDEQDYLAMGLIDHMTSLQANPAQSSPQTDELEKHLAAINHLLDQ